MSKVKQELGRDAVILHTRRFRKKGVLGLFGTEQVEVMAAAEDALPEEAAAAPACVSPLQPPPAVQLAQAAPPAPPVFRAATEAEPPAPWQQELAEMRSLLEEALRQSGRPGAEGAGCASAAVERLVCAEVDRTVGEELVRRDPILSQWRGPVKEPLFTERLEAVVAQALGEAEGISPAPDQPRVVALIGPTGVGKTTTIAKLAAHFSLQRGLKVALITADTYRISAVEQLKTYADIMGLPLEIVYAPQDVAKAVAKCSACHLILLDTAGRSPRNQEQLEELQALLQQVPQAEIHLVLSLTTRNRDALEIARRFSFCAPQKVLFTKLDEAGSCGMILNLLHQLPLQLSYVTTGQNVPDDLELFTASVLAQHLLHGGAHA